MANVHPVILSKNSLYIYCLPIQNDEEPNCIHRILLRQMQKDFSNDWKLAPQMFQGLEKISTCAFQKTSALKK